MYGSHHGADKTFNVSAEAWCCRWTISQLNEAVVITSSTPGPVGLYIVSVGYFVAGGRGLSRDGWR